MALRRSHRGIHVDAHQVLIIYDSLGGVMNNPRPILCYSHLLPHCLRMMVIAYIMLSDTVARLQIEQMAICIQAGL